MIEIEPGLWALFTGDLNDDDNIDLLDNSILENDINDFLFGYFESDMNGDGNTDLLDNPILESNIYSFIFSFQPNWSGTLPSLSTSPVTSISIGSAISGGYIITDGANAITSKGVCWSMNPHPTILDTKTLNGGGAGSFTSNLSGLLPGKTYYVRAYATNAVGTVYGNEVLFVSAGGQN